MTACSGLVLALFSFAGVSAIDLEKAIEKGMFTDLSSNGGIHESHLSYKYMPSTAWMLEEVHLSSSLAWKQI